MMRGNIQSLRTHGWFPGPQLGQVFDSSNDLNGGTPLKIRFSLQLGLLNLELGVKPKTSQGCMQLGDSRQPLQEVSATCGAD